MLHVRLLGGLTLEADGHPLQVPAGRPARELLAWLALNPGTHSRLDVAMRFWPDVPETSARASLRTTLHELRRALGDAASALAVDREHVGLTGVTVDLADFDRLAPEQALEAGEPLAGIERDWAIAARDEHRERVSALLARYAERPDGLRWAREAVRRDPLSEDAARRLMRALTAAGDRAAAMAEYVRLEDRLERELSVAPSRETRRLLAEIRAGAAPPLGTAARLPLPPALAPRGAPLAGREPELTRLIATATATSGTPTPRAAGRSSSGAASPRAAGPTSSGPSSGAASPLAAGPTSSGPSSGAASPLAAGLSSGAAPAGAAAPRPGVFLAGEPGIGKTRLLAEAARAAYARGATVRYGRCYEEQVAPYEPFAEALGPETLARLLEEAGGERWRLFDAIGARLEGSVIALDDLHWADAGTLRLLAHVLRRPRPPAVLGAYRASETGRDHPLAALLADLGREGLAERVPLRGLSADEVARMGGGPEIAEATGGNPFFVEEVLRHGATAAIPEGVKDVIGRRLSRLAPETGRVLGIAAVAGRTFDLALLEAVTDADVLAALEEAAAAQMLREERPGAYTFAHALVRETLYEDLSLTRRARIHKALADALEGGGAPGELAHHRLEAGDAAPAADAALAAARAAMRALAYEEAAALAERALALEPDPPRRAELLLALGDARLRAGEPASEAFAAAAELARALAAAAGHASAAPTGAPAADATGAKGAPLAPAAGADALAPGPAGAASLAPSAGADALVAGRAEAAPLAPAAELLARAALGFSGLGVSIIAVDAEKVALLEEALAAVGEHPLRARLLARLAIETYYASTPAQRKALGDEAVALARPEDRLDALDARHAALWSAQYLDERLATAHEMLALAIQRRDAERELQARNWLVTDLFELGDIPAVNQEIEAHEALAEWLRLPAYTWWGPMWRATLAILEGRFADAEALIAQLAAWQHPNARLYAEIQRFSLEWTRGRFDQFTDTEPFEREIGRPAEYAYRAGYSWLLAAQGQADEARGQLDWLAQDDFARMRDDMNWLAAAAEMAQAITILGDPAHAAGVLERLAPYADRNVPNGRGAGGYGSAAFHVANLAALLGRDEEAQARYEQALRHNTELGSRPWAAFTRERYAALLERRGERDRAQALRAHALAERRALGIAP